MTVKCHSFAECKLISFRVLRLQIKQIQDCMCPEFCYVPSEKNMRSRLDTGDEVKRPCQRVVCAKSFFFCFCSFRRTPWSPFFSLARSVKQMHCLGGTDSGCCGCRRYGNLNMSLIVHLGSKK